MSKQQTTKQKNNEKTFIVNGYSWLDYASALSGYENFTKNGNRVFKYQLFWSGVNPLDVLKCKNGYNCNVLIKKRKPKNE
jgi:hypothetical protein